ncbi:hypothetical protein [Phyllobacterium sp. K27]
MIKVAFPIEALPELGTVSNPAVLYDGNDAYVCYETSDRTGGGNVVLKFGGVIDFRMTPMTAEGLRECRYPIKPWAFNEVFGGEETMRWRALDPRFWLISFNEVTIEIIFETVSIITHDGEGCTPKDTLLHTLTA